MKRSVQNLRNRLISLWSGRGDLNPRPHAPEAWPQRDTYLKLLRFSVYFPSDSLRLSLVY